MLMKIRKIFQRNPSIFYSMCIAATWAGGNSLIIGMATAKENGIIPFFIWTFANMLAPIIFGLLSLKIPKFQNTMESKPIALFLTIICIFQIWLQMNNIQSTLSGTEYISNNFAIIIAIVIAIFFVVLFLKDSFSRNILTDNYSWWIVYLLIFALMTCAYVISGGKINNLSLGIENVGRGIKDAILLLPGAFAYPVFWKMLRYNEKNDDKIRNINIERCFLYGGLLFGLYLLFVLALAFVSFNPILELVKAILIVVIASSTLSSFLYSLHCFAGKKVGTILSGLTIITWQLFIPLGVLNMWSLMSTVRLFVLLGAFIFSIGWYLKERLENKNKGELKCNIQKN